MITGFGSSMKVSSTYSDAHNNTSNLPVPFNIPNVLCNLLFEDIGIEFDEKQNDMLDVLRLSYKSLVKLQESHLEKNQEIRQKMLSEPDNISSKEELEELHLDMLHASHQFKEMVSVMSELLQREQYEQLLKFSNIPT